jgi:hypothetical protein
LFYSKNTLGLAKVYESFTGVIKMPESGLLRGYVFKGVHTLFLITALLRIFMAGLALPAYAGLNKQDYGT